MRSFHSALLLIYLSLPMQTHVPGNSGGGAGSSRRQDRTEHRTARWYEIRVHIGGAGSGLVVLSWTRGNRATPRCLGFSFQCPLRRPSRRAVRGWSEEEGLGARDATRLQEGQHNGDGEQGMKHPLQSSTYKKSLSFCVAPLRNTMRHRILFYNLALLQSAHPSPRETTLSLL